MSSLVIAIFMAIGIATWVFSKVMERTGGNTKNSIIITVITAIFVFVITLTLLVVLGNIIES